MRLRTVQGNETNYLEEIKTKEVIHPLEFKGKWEKELMDTWFDTSN